MKIFLYLIGGLLILPPPISANNLTINELMQSNIDCIMDDYNEFPDSWVELYNGTDADIDLSSYSIGTTNDAAEACALPTMTVKAGEYVVVYCDKQDAVDGLHMTFRLDSGKGAAVYLFNGGELVGEVSGLKKQPAPNVAYGHLDESSDTWGYQSTPTPGAANCGTLLSDVLGDPKFSIEGGIYDAAVNLTLSLPKKAPAGTVIRYTLDGTEPTELSPAYESEITIESSTAVRAKLFCDGYLSPISTTHSYLMPDHNITLPVVSIVGNPDYFYSDSMGILVEGADPDEPNYENEWRRPINIEFFPDPNGAAAFNQLSETRVKGGYSRIFPLKSMVVYANKRFGTKRFTYEFFPDQAPGLNEWKSFELRNAGNDFRNAYMRDAVIQRSMGENCDLDWQPMLQSVLMINGEYKGLINIRPRSNDDYIYTFYDGLEDIDMFENWNELKNGDRVEYDKLKALYNSDSGTAEQYRAAIDVDEFFNLMIMNIYYANLDFPTNNIVMWRERTDNARWRWIAKDTDYGLGLRTDASYKTLDWIFTPGYDPDLNWGNQTYGTQLFASLLAIDELKEDFINKFTIYMGDFLKGATVEALADHYYNNIKDEHPYHYYVNYGTTTDYAKKVQKIKQWAVDREAFFPEYLGEYFDLGTPVKLTVNGSGNDDSNITVNGIQLRTKQFGGTHFANSELTLTEDSPEFTSWEVTVDKDGETTTENYPDRTLTYTLPECEAVKISAKTASSGITSIANDAQSSSVDLNAPFEAYAVSGISLGVFDSLQSAESALSPGIYILRQDAAVTRIAIK